MCPNPRSCACVIWMERDRTDVRLLRTDGRVAEQRLAQRPPPAGVLRFGCLAAPRKQRRALWHRRRAYACVFYPARPARHPKEALGLLRVRARLISRQLIRCARCASHSPKLPRPLSCVDINKRVLLPPPNARPNSESNIAHRLLPFFYCFVRALCTSTRGPKMESPDGPARDRPCPALGPIDSLRHILTLPHATPHNGPVA